MVHLPIALQAYSVRDFLQKDFTGTLRRIKAMGYDGVEFAGLYGHTPEEVKAICEEIGLTVVSSIVGIPELLADPEGAIAELVPMGMQFIVISYLPEEYRPGTENFPKVLEAAKRAGAAAKKYGIRLCYHNHDFEFEKFGEKYVLDVIFDSVPAELLETELDVCWIKEAGECPVKYLKKYAGRSHVVHLKDFVGSRIQEVYDENGKVQPLEFRPLGRGIQDFPPILAAAVEAGAQWLVVEQDSPSLGLDAFQCAEESLRYLKSL